MAIETTDRNKNAGRRVLRRFNRVTRDGRRALTAYHEAAHAVAFAAHMFSVESIDLVPKGDSLARTMHGGVIQAASDKSFDACMADPELVEITLYQAQAYIHGLVAGPIAEMICRGERFDYAWFDSQTYWFRGVPWPLERLPPGSLQHTDRDKAYLTAERLLRARPSLAANASDHLRSSCSVAYRILAERRMWAAVQATAEAALRTNGLDWGQLGRVLAEHELERLGMETWAPAVRQLAHLGLSQPTQPTGTLASA